MRIASSPLPTMGYLAGPWLASVIFASPAIASEAAPCGASGATIVRVISELTEDAYVELETTGPNRQSFGRELAPGEALVTTGCPADSVVVRVYRPRRCGRGFVAQFTLAIGSKEESIVLEPMSLFAAHCPAELAHRSQSL